MKYYTGIGSRQTPKDICHFFTNVAQYLQSHGWILRSGGADGADSAFSDGCQNKQIFLPWLGFNKKEGILADYTKSAEIAQSFHPVWARLSNAAKKLHARNVNQVLGECLQSPSKFVVCWTPDGKITGGTATAINIALYNNIPVLNVGNICADRCWDKFYNFLEVNCIEV